MTIEATAQALATDEAQQVEHVADAPAEMTEEQEMSNVWDALQDGAKTPEPEAEEVEATDSDADEANEADSVAAEPETDEGEEEAETETAAQEVEAPTDMPKAMRDVWKDIPEVARNEIVERERKFGRQLAEQGRLLHGIRPIQDVLQRATQDLPGLANMRPEEVAQEAMQLAKISNDFATKPVETMMSLIKQHRLEEPLRKLFEGNQPDNASLQNNQLQQQVQQLQRQLHQLANPDYLRDQMEQFTTQSQVQSSVEQFSQSAEHWNYVEQHMPNAIHFVKASNPDASATDVLQRAYDLAVSQFVPEANKATQNGTADLKAKPVADPEKTQAARKAKSVNVKSNASGKTRTLTEAEELSRAYDKMQN